LEKFCLELDEEERRKREKAQKKRDKKSKQKLNRSNRMNNKEVEDNRVSNSPTPPPQQKVSKCPKVVNSQGRKAISQVVIDHPPTHVIDNQLPVTAIPSQQQQPTEKRKVPVITARNIQDVPSLESMLKDVDKDNEENFIPLEDIRAFQARFPVVNRQREELRKNLRQRFNQLCVNGL